MSYLKNHPFDVEAFFESSLVLTFAVAKDEVRNLIPHCLELDTLNDKWAFIAVAMVQTKGLRPKGFPSFLGNDFFLIGYRIFVRYTTKSGKKLRGLYIIKSETNKRKMKFLGNIFTHYNYTTTDVFQIKDKGLRTIQSQKSKFNIVIDQMDGEIDLPENSPFNDWKEARKFAGPLPFTFTYSPKNKSVLIIEGVRRNWLPIPVKLQSYSIGFLDGFNFKDIVLANVFEIKNIPYYWKKGVIDKWS